jgi:hypothetical protein
MDKNVPLKYRFAWAGCSGAALSICYILCRFTFLDMHRMKQWPFALFAFGLLVILVSAKAYSRKVMICTVAGYAIGFAAGMIFNTDRYNEHMARYNNAWIIWSISFISLIIVGVIWEGFCYLKKHRN